MSVCKIHTVIDCAISTRTAGTSTVSIVGRVYRIRTGTVVRDRDILHRREFRLRVAAAAIVDV